MESSMNSLLELHNIYYSYHTLDAETRALSDLSFSVQPGTFTSVVGPSGCGKSTLLSLICGLMKPDAGEILLNSIPLKENSPLIGYMLQHDHLLDWRSIYRNVTLGPEICGTLNTATKKRAYELLEQYGLRQFASARPSQLSGGMRQRAALIRTLLPDPQLLLLDEPFSALDYQTRLSVCDDIASIIKKENKTAILVTHDLSEAISVADRVIVLSSRPATVRRIVPISVSIPDRTPMRTRNAPEFKDYFNLLWKELNHHE